ncbi:tyrosine-type recombinase/integrase [Novosphingobium sp.]|jgi:integrase|uniref:tyrosine-type recombinase/integrase n=1 Tax=Novosphingobium sp. TaxID=1874826 RepID=UPI002FE2FE8C
MLTDKEVKNAEPRDKPYKLSDANGLYLYVAKTGLKSWRFKFRLHGQEKLLTFGPYPEVKLSEARAKRDEARQRIRNGEDPSGARKRKQEETRRARFEAAQALSFETIARTWHEQYKDRWTPVHQADVLLSLERDIFPFFGTLPLAEIDSPTILRVLRAVEDRGAIETARRLRQRVSAVFVYAIGEGIATVDPAAVVLKALKPMPKAGRQPALANPTEGRKLLKEAEASAASPITKLASRLLALTQARPGMVCAAEWSEFEGIDWSDRQFGPFQPLWRVPAHRMKLKVDQKDEEVFEHLVPLSWQAVDVLRAVRRLTGRGRLVFPGHRSSGRPLSGNAMSYLYNRVGYHGRHVPHGWRATFSTTMNDLAKKRLRPDDSDVIELMLAHVPENKVKAAYDRAGHMERRRELSQEWADMLMKGMCPADDILSTRRRN